MPPEQPTKAAMTMGKTCPVCHKVFEDTKHLHRVFCSYTCAGLAKRTTKEKECPTCGVVFRKPTVYCSQECARPSFGWARGQIRTRYTKKCEICGNDFETVPTSSKQHCCSLECAAKKRQKDKIKASCKICGKEILFLASRNKVYCGTDCKIKGLAINKLERHKKTRILGRWKDRKSLKRWLIEKYGKCQLCNWDKELGILEAHHIDRNKKNNTEQNLLLLCPNCHSLEHFNGKDGQYKNNLGVKSYAFNGEGKISA